MPTKKSRGESRKTRRQILAAGLAGLAGTTATYAQTDKAARTLQSPDSWTPKKEVILRPGQKPSSGALLSSCIRSGHLLFLAGIGGWYPNQSKEPGDAKSQVQSALTRMKETLEAAGSSMANVLKVHMTVADPQKNLSLLNEGYRGFFPDPPPVRSYSGTGAEHMGRAGVIVQIDCIAYVD